MKRICLVAVILVLASFAAGAQTQYNLKGKDLPSSRRVTTTLRAVFPIYLGTGTLVDSPDYGFPGAAGLVKNFTFGIEPLGLRFAAKGSPLESNLALRYTYVGMGAYAPKLHAGYLGFPFRVACKVGRSGKVFANASIDLLLTRNALTELPLNPLRASMEGGISWGALGLWTGLGLTPVFQTGNTAKTLSFGIVVEI